jgi:hypothetical protein
MIGILLYYWLEKKRYLFEESFSVVYEFDSKSLTNGSIQYSRWPLTSNMSL